MRKPKDQVGERQVRLKPQYAHLYRDVPPNEWWPAWVLAERLLAAAESQGISSEERICNPTHFQFRGGQSLAPRLQDLRTRRTDSRM